MTPQLSLQDAKNKFSEVVNAALKGKPQTVTRRSGSGGGAVRGNAAPGEAVRPGFRRFFAVHAVRCRAGQRKGRSGRRREGADATGGRVLMYLLDTVVLSELRKAERNAGLTVWLSGRRYTELFLSVASIGEIERGIRAVGKKDEAFAGRLAFWWDKLLSIYADRILPVSVGIARRWGQVSASVGNAGADPLIAATALEHNLTVITRNVSPFKLTGARTLNPWS